MNKVTIILLILIIGSFSWYFFWPKSYKVELRSDGFYPATLTVPAGSTVVFTGKIDRAFWPASNFHPSHKLYPKFDAQEPVLAGESWQFHFEAPGIWRYHDHMNSRNTGTIVVRNSPWAKSFACKAEACFIQQIEEVLTKKGIDQAFELFGKLYESHSDFSSDCHDVTHLLGDAAYREYVKNGKVIDSVKTSYCGYGFYHGFIEALLFTTGNFEQAKGYCRAVQEKLSEIIVSPNAIYSCYHGLGHGTFDTMSSEVWGDDEKMLTNALDTCEKVTMKDEAELIKQCGTGVFNALANAYNNKTYDLSFNEHDPWGICTKQVNLEYKKACFREVAASYIKGTIRDRGAALTMIGNIPDRIGAAATMYAYMSDEARMHLDTPVETWAVTCENVAISSVRQSCVEGVATGLFLWGAPGHEHEKAIEFCASAVLSGGNKEACFAYVLPRIKTVYDQQRVGVVCKSMNPDYQRYCQ